MPAIERAHDVPLDGEARSGLYFCGLFVQSLFICSTFCYIFITCFSLFCSVCVLFSKIKSFGFGTFFSFLRFFVLVKLESGSQKKTIYPVLIWF